MATNNTIKIQLVIPWRHKAFIRISCAVMQFAPTGLRLRFVKWLQQWIIAKARVIHV